MKLRVLASLFALCASFVAATPNPIPGSYPAIWYNPSSKKYYVFSTGEGIKIFTAPALTGPWTRTSSVLPGGSSINLAGNKDLWAPDVNYIQGLYTLYYAVSTIGSQNSAIGVATSPSMDAGTWTDLGEVIGSVPGDVYNAIDPNIIDDNGLKLSFGSYWEGMYQIGLWPGVKDQASALPGTHLAGGSGRAAEGGFVYKPRNSQYTFFFFSDGVTPLAGSTSRPAPGKEYKVLVGRGANAMGPFYGQLGHTLTENIDPPTGSLVLGSHDNIYAPGGQSVFLDPVSGRDVIVYHYVRNSDPNGSPSYLGINYLDFSSGWPVVVD
ncbi:Arabinanase/levansucrase/invertase [Gloeophyllum trabeum ATCC 11539]|uniref:Endo-1,5-alpha-L-arabinanase A n=1 Tax=Gloeophyllum trabeum (strain ATCC 11539 / FP-39264 / Madison 617) TaxID=670483 RepID=S7RP95_GLOTA|nr:Arabinanase/levansucrase/invertase [Gloeophyllum trabeum ATCC 11539]EPQ54639.1 Arabinanase/levansucrase/invertase [Gloeophyllum trabeum ATCC 11539]